MWQVISILIGLACGSFINVVISRLKIDKAGQNTLDWQNKRSYCMKCKQELAWYDLIPIASFVLLKGKCRYCEAKIPAYHIVVEILSGLIAFLLYYQFGITVFSIASFVISLLLLAILVYDWQTKLIPDSLLKLALLVGILLQIYNLALQNITWLDLLLGAIAGGGLFYLLYIISKGKWLGFGDVKLGLVLGLIVAWPKIILLLWLGIVIGGLIGSGMMLFGNAKLKSKIAFGPFLIIGYYLVLFWGPELLNLVSVYCGIE